VIVAHNHPSGSIEPSEADEGSHAVSGKLWLSLTCAFSTTSSWATEVASRFLSTACSSRSRTRPEAVASCGDGPRWYKADSRGGPSLPLRPKSLNSQGCFVCPASARSPASGRLLVTAFLTRTTRSVAASCRTCTLNVSGSRPRSAGVPAHFGQWPAHDREEGHRDHPAEFRAKA